MLKLQGFAYTRVNIYIYIYIYICIYIYDMLLVFQLFEAETK